MTEGWHVEEVPDDLIAESFDHGVWWASAGLNSAMFHTCMICGATVTERNYGSPINRRRHLRWHQQIERRPFDPDQARERALGGVA